MIRENIETNVNKILAMLKDVQFDAQKFAVIKERLDRMLESAEAKWRRSM